MFNFNYEVLMRSVNCLSGFNLAESDQEASRLGDVICLLSFECFINAFRMKCVTDKSTLKN